MKYLKQFGVILGFSFLGEILHAALPFPLPASIYGLVLLAAALIAGLVRSEQIRETAGFLVALLSLIFVGPCVNLMDYWEVLRPLLFPVLATIVISAVLTFGAAGGITELLLRLSGKEDASCGSGIGGKDGSRHD